MNLRDHIVRTPSSTGRNTSHQSGLLKVLSNLVLNNARVGASTTSLISLFQGLTTLTVSLNFPFFNLCPLLLFLSVQLLMKSRSPASLQAHSDIGRLLWGLHTAFSSPSWTAQTFTACLHRGVLQSSYQLHGPLLDLLQQFHVLLVLGAPEL